MKDFDPHPNGKANLKGIHDNIRTTSVMSELIDNLDYIPVEALEQFVNQYKQL